MTNFEKIKEYYAKGIYKERHIKAFLDKGVLTKKEYNEILSK